MSARDGGPAFPGVLPQQITERWEGARGSGGATYTVGGAPGMSLRDYFAGQALPALIAGAIRIAEINPREVGPSIMSEVGASAFVWADAMLKARNA